MIRSDWRAISLGTMLAAYVTAYAGEGLSAVALCAAAVLAAVPATVGADG